MFYSGFFLDETIGQLLVPLSVCPGAHVMWINGGKHWAMWVNCESMWRCHCISVLFRTGITTICQTSNPKLFMTYIRPSSLWFHSWGFHIRKYPFAFCFNTSSIQIVSPTANLLQVVGSWVGFLTTLVFNNLYCIQLRLRSFALVLPLPLSFGVFLNKLWQSHNVSSRYLFIYLFFHFLFLKFRIFF
jgi:hypothetical protein